MGQNGSSGWQGPGEGASWFPGENIWLPSSPTLQVGLYYFCKTGAANLFTDSRISLVHRDSQVQGVTWEVSRETTSWPEMCPLLPTSPSLLWVKHCPWQE